MTGGPPRLDLLVLGAGLIGTSLGLAVRGRWDVALHDEDPAVLAAAVARGAGRAWDRQQGARLVVACTPPSVTARVLTDAQRAGAGRTYTHVASVQAAVQRDLGALGADLSAVCGGHPMAGRERRGPAAGDGELFTGRPWVLCPSGATAPGALQDVRALVLATGAEPLELDPDAHDAAVALVSHLPQVAASALAAQLLRRPPSSVALSGPGLQDTTRIAGSDPALWGEVLARNAGNVAPLVRALAADLAQAADALQVLADGAPSVLSDGPPQVAPDGAPQEPADGAPALTVEQLLQRGVQGRHLVPVKRGEPDEAFVSVAVSVPDRPGQIAGVLTSAADGGVNVEDVRVDHVPGRARGVVELLVRGPARGRAEQVLRAAGWDVVGRGAGPG